jgi:hypothetical protein
MLMPCIAVPASTHATMCGVPLAGIGQRDIGGGGGTAVPSLSRRAGLCLHPGARSVAVQPERGVLFESSRDSNPSAGPS